MAQHFLLSAAARTLSLKPAFTMGEDKAFETFCQMRWPETDGDAVPYVRDHVGTLATIHADEGTGWDALHAGWDRHRVNHSVAFKDEGACSNQAESFFSRLRRMEVGTRHHIAGPYLASYAGEALWREDNRRVPNGEQAGMALRAALAASVSRRWKGYWQKGA